jgi:hypothetical protein
MIAMQKERKMKILKSLPLIMKKGSEFSRELFMLLFFAFLFGFC